MKTHAGSPILLRIEDALSAAALSISPFLLHLPKTEFKSGKGPVTEADRTANRVLREALLRDGEGWLSEESVDDLSRLEKNSVWVVDPIDGTREFISRVPEWCISVGYVENGRATAGGICNPVSGEIFLGSLDEGVKLNGVAVGASSRPNLEGAVVLASRSEMARGEWDRFRSAPFVSRPTGSVAYKLALVAAGKADATWTACPKNEWDIAAGAALLEAAGAFVRDWNGRELRFNNPSTRVNGLMACAPQLSAKLDSWLHHRAQAFLDS